MYNIHTKETLTLAFKRNGAYIPEAMEKISRFMRDWRRDEAHRMDPELIDLMWSLHGELGSREPMHLVSGYRSPRTNESLRRSGGGQARFSQHMLGKAADIYFPDIPIKQLRYAALIHERGGVGYYPNSGVPFVHVDTGSIRAWPKLPRMELALLFPSGRTKHQPADGRTLTRDDARVALASLRNSGGELPLALRRLRKDQAGPILASYRPSGTPFTLAKVQSARTNGKAESLGTAPAADPAATPALSPAGRPASLAEPAVALNAPLASAPSETLTPVVSEYDDEDPDEFYYQPFPLAPLMTETSVASVNFEDEPRAPAAVADAMVYADPNAMLSATFEKSLQYAGLFWASRFSGQAVSSALVAQAARTQAALIQTASAAAVGSAPATKAAARSETKAAAVAVASAAPAHPTTARRSSEAAAASAAKQPASTVVAKAAPATPSQAVATASASGGGGGSGSGSSFWSSLFSTPQTSYGFSSGD